MSPHRLSLVTKQVLTKLRKANRNRCSFCNYEFRLGDYRVIKSRRGGSASSGSGLSVTQYCVDCGIQKGVIEKENLKEIVL